MAGGKMEIFNTEGEDHLGSIVYFLSESLRSAIEAGDALQQSVCEAPQFAPHMETCEIADRLAGFRRQMSELWGREMLMLTKIVRAGELARELRLFEAELKPEIDTFRLATVMAAELRDRLLPTIHTTFNGAVQPKRFFEARGHFSTDSVAIGDTAPAYRVAGEVDVRLLIDACEALHFSLAGRYGMETTALLLDVADEVISDALPGEDLEEPFLLSELEIVSETASGPQPFWRSGAPIGRILPH